MIKLLISNNVSRQKYISIVSPDISVFFRKQSLKCNPSPSFQLIFPEPKTFITGMNHPGNFLQM
jgi:hypothetical protein